MINSILHSNTVTLLRATKFLKCLTMSKISRTFITVCIILLFFGTWLFGSLIVIQIDSIEQFEHSKNYPLFQKRNRELQQNVDSYCRLADKKYIVKGSLQHTVKEQRKFDDGKKNQAHSSWENARKEKLIRENLIYFPSLKQMWCLVPKAASTSWSKAIVERLNSFEDSNSIFLDPNSTDSLQVVLKKNFGNIDRTTFVNAAKWESVKKVLLVRHPFSRIASAYRDKLFDRKAKVDGMHFFQQFGVQMNRKYRKSRKDVKQKEPTFQEFVDYIIDTKPLDLNEHWQPISLMCGLCHIRYDHIIMMEDLEDTKEWHLHELGFPEGYQLPLENQNSGKYNSKELFRNISNSKKIKLLEKYQEDFRLFGYSFLNHYIS